LPLAFPPVFILALLTIFGAYIRLWYASHPTGWLP